MDNVNRRHALRAVASCSAVVALVFGPVAPALADGPGYGGDAGALAVTWESTSTSLTTTSDYVPIQVPDAPASEQPASDQPASDLPPEEQLEPDPLPEPEIVSMGGSVRGVGAIVRIRAADPELHNDALDLMVRGLGFRGKSEVEVRIGSESAVVARADSAGALAVSLDQSILGTAKPGVSVMAVGRNQAGTEVTLFGSIPPQADGSGPMSVVPWAAVGIVLTGFILWARRRVRHSA
jgi:hypothetical protein